MFTYFEGYHPSAWKGLEKRGLLRKNTGLRFCQNIMLSDDMKFNQLAKVGGDFYRIQQELDCPMYIDRLQGGCYIDTYPYDEALLADYRNRLGDKFWGFQMHEWMSNYYSDLDKLDKNLRPDWTAEAIKAEIFRQFPMKYLFLEAMTAEEMASFPRPETAEEFYAVSKWLLQDRLSRYKELIPCDSFLLAFKMELESEVNPVRRFMPEIGGQCSDTRLMVTYAGSMAKAYGKEFGVYYEPWGGEACTACCYNRVPADNEWGIGKSSDFPSVTAGPNGGSSRSLQKRVHLYSYFSGAAFMSEEWGVCNTFLDWQDHELSPYGQVKKDFLDLTDKYPEPGKKLSPIAVVLPREMDVLDNIYDLQVRFGFTVPGEGYSRIKSALQRIFAQSDPMLGTEIKNLKNNRFPDAVDLLHSDAKNLGDYTYLVDLSGGQIPAKLQERLISEEEIIPKALECLPCAVTGSCHWMVTERSDGGYFLVIFNHSGVHRTVAEGEQLLPEAETHVEITVKNRRTLKPLEGSSKVSWDGKKYSLTVAPGDWFLGEF